MSINDIFVKVSEKGGPCVTSETDGKAECSEGEMLYLAKRGSGVDCEQGRQSFSLQHRLDFVLRELRKQTQGIELTGIRRYL